MAGRRRLRGHDDLAAGGAFFPAISFFYRAKTPEVIAAVFAANRPGTEREHDLRPEGGIVVIPIPTRQIHSVTKLAFGVKYVPNIMNIRNEKVSAGFAAKMVDAKDPQNLSQTHLAAR
jgi:hypothetical protein